MKFSLIITSFLIACWTDTIESSRTTNLRPKTQENQASDISTSKKKSDVIKGDKTPYLVKGKSGRLLLIIPHDDILDTEEQYEYYDDDEEESEEVKKES